MNWRIALHDPTFLRFTAIIAGVLLLAGFGLALLTFGLKKNVEKVWTIWRSWLVMIPLALGAVLLGRVATVGGATLLAIFAFKEFARATGLYRDWFMTSAAYLCMIAVGAIILAPEFFPAISVGRAFAFLVAAPPYAVMVFLLVPILRNRTQSQLQNAALAVLGFLCVGWLFMHAAFLVNSPRAYGQLMFLTFAVEAADISAYTFGNLLGRHALRSNISPKKTWEGAIGAFGIAMALPWVLAFALPDFAAWEKIVAGLIVGIAGPCGDLAISLIKREVGIKDMANTIPGHGGILDRIDSLIFAAPLFLHLVMHHAGVK